MAVFWYGPVAFANRKTDDSSGRVLRNVVTRTLPLAFRIQKEDQPQHLGAVTVGTVQGLGRIDDTIMGWGTLLETEDGKLAAQLIEERAQPFVSLDPGYVEATYFYVVSLDGEEQTISEQDYYDDWDEWADWNIVDSRVEFTTYEIAGVTSVGVQAFSDARVSITKDQATAEAAMTGTTQLEVSTSVSASAGALTDERYPADALVLREYSELTPFRIEPDGRFFGHLWAHGQCHRTFTVGGECWTPNKSDDFTAFNDAGPRVRLSDGTLQNVGIVAFRAKHNDALQAYENSTYQFGVARVGRDEFGVHCSGIAHPWNRTQDILDEALASWPSGDWVGPTYATTKLMLLALVSTPGMSASDSERIGNKLQARVSASATVFAAKPHGIIKPKPAGALGSCGGSCGCGGTCGGGGGNNAAVANNTSASAESIAETGTESHASTGVSPEAVARLVEIVSAITPR